MDSDGHSLNHVNYLIKAASLLPTENHFHKLLRSYYLTKCRRLAHSDDKNSKTLFSEEEMCRKCSTPWFDANYSLSIAPIKTTKRKAQKIHKQIENKSKRKNHLAKKLSKKVNNRLTVKCNLCNNKSKVILWKKPPTDPQPIGHSLNETNEAKVADELKNEPLKVPTVEVQSNEPSKKKRKKNKNKNAGLLYTLNKEDNSVQKIVNINQRMQTMKIQKSTNAPKSFSKNVNQPLNKNKGQAQNQSKAKSKNKSAKVSKNIPQPAVKRNSILQLANALKAKGNQSSSSSQADKLKQMLR